MSNSNFPEGNDPNKNPINPTVVQDPIDSSQRVLARNTVTGFEQGIAAVIDYLPKIGAPVLGPKGVQGKMDPMGAYRPASIIIIINFPIFIIIAAVIAAVSEEYSQTTNPKMYLMAVSSINLDIDHVNKNKTYSFKEWSNKQNI